MSLKLMRVWRTYDTIDFENSSEIATTEESSRYENVFVSESNSRSDCVICCCCFSFTISWNNTWSNW
ncbi:Oidioi.mRNA.OKI2018_I69.chr1.g2551.t1.cds [Oikopleura dioica]|uniref:Oidioi.mRNA.OKI2018_I69.chr1.g2551.t1.cds n=1 Tax=Oikopleura dioica TaxID=34765 RepID=A0ABN7SS25_OIKDI|nr:Oidioi.mRNA.OKI2018_I69.chr1.g2551.t1.cds [Oikopleura dioica]